MRTAGLAWMLGVIGVAACTSHDGAGESGIPVVISGLRLRARWQVAGDARQLIGWHDTTLDVDCDFSAYVAGRAHRCLPTVALLGGGDFSDSACTRPIATGVAPYTAVDPPRYVMQPAANTCESSPQFFAALPPVMATTYFLNQGVCTAEVARLTYPAGAAVAETTFAAASESHDLFGQMWLNGDDGSRIPWAGWDGQRSVRPSTSTWTPWIVAYNGEGFVDAQCTVYAAAKYPDTARCPIEAALVYDFSNDDGVSYAELGAPLDHVYQLSQGLCTESAADPMLTFEIGAAIPTASLKPMTTRIIGEGPVGVQYAVLDGHVVRQTGADPVQGSPSADPFIDAASGFPCAAYPAADGVTRCTPLPGDPASVDLFYLDAACTQMILLEAPTGQASLFAYYAADGKVHVRPVASTASTTTAQIYYQDAEPTDACAPAVDHVGGTYFSLGDELPADRFVPITLAVD